MRRRPRRTIRGRVHGLRRRSKRSISYKKKPFNRGRRKDEIPLVTYVPRTIKVKHRFTTAVEAKSYTNWDGQADYVQNSLAQYIGFKCENIYDPYGPTAVSTSALGYTEMAAVYNVYRVLGVWVSFKVFLRPTQNNPPVQFGIRTHSERTNNSFPAALPPFMTSNTEWEVGNNGVRWGKATNAPQLTTSNYGGKYTTVSKYIDFTKVRGWKKPAYDETRGIGDLNTSIWAYLCVKSDYVRIAKPAGDLFDLKPLVICKAVYNVQWMNPTTGDPR